MDTGVGDFCSLMKNLKSPFFLVRYWIDAFKEKAPQFIHKCPFVGLHESKNFTFPKEYTQMIPAGKFMAINNYYDGEEELFSGILKTEFFD
jgi:Protein of unknown function (DUF1091)